MIRAAIFDLDGTLVHSLPGIAHSLNEGLAQHGFPSHSEEAVQGFIGNGSRVLCRRGLPAGSPDATVDAVHAAFLADYETAWREGSTLYPGIADLLADLRGEGLPLAVLSNKPHPFTVEMVEALFAPGTFAKVLGHRPETPRKPDPFSAIELALGLDVPCPEVAFIGDSTVDYDTAANARMQPLLVSWGYRPLEELKATGAPVHHSPAQLRKCLPGLH